MRVFFNYQSDNACAFHRVLQPARFLSPIYEPRGHTFTVGQDLPPGHDVYVIHGVPDGFILGDVLKRQYAGAKIVWGTDDDWKTIAPTNPLQPTEDQLAVYHHLTRWANHILVSTPYLASTFPTRPDVLVAPNLLDMRAFPVIPHTVREDGGRAYSIQSKTPVRIAWVGAAAHVESHEILIPVIEDAVARHGDKIQVVFFGKMPPSQIVKHLLHRGVLYQQGVPFGQYQPVLNTLDPHVYLCPMGDIPFNYSRSNLRVIEGWGLAAAPIVTPLGAYAGLVRAGTDGLYAANRADWAQAIDYLIDPKVRIPMAINGRVRAEREWDWNNQSCLGAWISVFNTILSGS